MIAKSLLVASCLCEAASRGVLDTAKYEAGVDFKSRAAAAAHYDTGMCCEELGDIKVVLELSKTPAICDADNKL